MKVVKNIALDKLATLLSIIHYYCLLEIVKKKTLLVLNKHTSNLFSKPNLR
jgi:hypothetical protein